MEKGEKIRKYKYRSRKKYKILMEKWMRVKIYVHKHENTEASRYTAC